MRKKLFGWVVLGLGWVLSAVRLLLDIVGYSTADDDAAGLWKDLQPMINDLLAVPVLWFYGLMCGLIVVGLLLLVPSRVWSRLRDGEPGPIAKSEQPLLPDMSFRELFVHIHPDAIMKRYDAVENELLDYLINGHITAYGRPVSQGDTSFWSTDDPEAERPVAALRKIPAEEWNHFRLDAVFAMDGAPATFKQTTTMGRGLGYDYSDLRVHRAEALRVWPPPRPVSAANNRMPIHDAASLMYDRAIDRLKRLANTVEAVQANLDDKQPDPALYFIEVLKSAAEEGRIEMQGRKTPKLAHERIPADDFIGVALIEDGNMRQATSNRIEWFDLTVSEADALASLAELENDPGDST